METFKENWFFNNQPNQLNKSVAAIIEVEERRNPVCGTAWSTGDSKTETFQSRSFFIPPSRICLSNISSVYKFCFHFS
jgi:hypothetical protein